MSDWESVLPYDWKRDVASARGRARLALGALAITVVVRGYIAAVSAWQVSLLGGSLEGRRAPLETIELSDSLYQIGVFAQLGLLLVTAVLFLRWLAQTVNTARSMITLPHLRWTGSSAVWGFFMPFANLVRPYQVMRDLHDRLDPEGVPEPAARPRLDGTGGYRTVAMVRPPLPRALPHASIGAWWALYIGGGVIENITSKLPDASVEALLQSRRAGIFADGMQIAGAIFAILVVRAVDGRLAERYRRLHHASNEELVAWGFDR